MRKPFGIACNEKDLTILLSLHKNELIGALGNTAWQCTIVIWDTYQLATLFKMIAITL